MTLLKIWFMSWSVLGLSCFRPKYIRAKVGIGPKYYLSRSIPRAEMCLRPKYAWGQSEWGAKVLFRPNWVWAVRCPCPPWSKKKSSRFTLCALQMRSRSCRFKNLETTSAPKVKETPRSFSPQPWTSLSGSDHRRSHNRPGNKKKIVKIQQRKKFRRD